MSDAPCMHVPCPPDAMLTCLCVHGTAQVARIEPMEQPLRVMRLSDKAVLPVRGSAGAAGYDLAR